MLPSSQHTNGRLRFEVGEAPIHDIASHRKAARWALARVVAEWTWRLSFLAGIWLIYDRLGVLRDVLYTTR